MALLNIQNKLLLTIMDLALGVEFILCHFRYFK